MTSNTEHALRLLQILSFADASEIRTNVGHHSISFSSTWWRVMIITRNQKSFYYLHSQLGKADLHVSSNKKNLPVVWQQKQDNQWLCLLATNSQLFLTLQCLDVDDQQNISWYAFESLASIPMWRHAFTEYTSPLFLYIFHSQPICKRPECTHHRKEIGLMRVDFATFTCPPKELFGLLVIFWLFCSIACRTDMPGSRYAYSLRSLLVCPETHWKHERIQWRPMIHLKQSCLEPWP